MQKSKLPISVFIITQDEAHNLPRLLDSLQPFAEIVVVDSGSRDNTLAIAEQAGARIVQQAWLGYAGQKQFALEQCTQEWVLNLDADEVCTQEMIAVMQTYMQQPHVAGLRFRRKDQFMNRFPPLLASPQRNLRFYRRDKAAFQVNKMVHESAQVEGAVVNVDAYFLHYGYNDVATLLNKINQYSSLRAEEKVRAGKKGSLLKLVLIFPIEFLRQYLLKKLVFFGYRGFVLAQINAFYAMLKEAKTYALAQSRREDKS